MNYICVGTPINLPGGLLTPVRNEGIFTLVLRASMEFGGLTEIRTRFSELELEICLAEAGPVKGELNVRK